jgi:hypothetical protein
VSEDQPWAWNDLSVDSIHQTVAFSLVEFEPPLQALRNHGVPSEPIQWPTTDGGNGHYYQLVLALEPADWNAVRARAEANTFRGVRGHLATLDEPGEQDFVIQRILHGICGIPHVMIGLSGDLRAEELRWVDGSPATGLEIARPNLPTEQVYVQICWPPDHWFLQAVALDVLPGGWFGYLVEYPSVDESNGAPSFDLGVRRQVEKEAAGEGIGRD